MKSGIFAVCLVIVGFSGNDLSAQECVYGSYDHVTDDFFFEASSGDGSPGEVIAVDIFLTVEILHAALAGITAVGCYDSSLGELVGEPLYTDAFKDLAYTRRFFRLGGAIGPHKEDGGAGFTLEADFSKDKVQEYILEGQRLQIGTLFFMLNGKAGDMFEIRFCDNEFRFILGETACLYSFLYYIPSFVDQLIAHSSRHVAGEVKIDGRTAIPGDVDVNQKVNLSDAVIILGDLFLGDHSIGCKEAADFDNNGSINLTDAIAILNYLFNGGKAPNSGKVFCSQ